MSAGVFYVLNICMEINNTENLSITDLAVIKNIIDVATERGAFRAPELATVGQVYNKLSSFLNQVVKQAESDQESAQSQGEVK